MGNITKEQAIDWLCRLRSDLDWENPKHKLMFKNALSEGIKSLEERKQGEWKRVIDKSGHLVWECDCGWQERIATKFCPDCGIKMK